MVKQFRKDPKVSSMAIGPDGRLTDFGKNLLRNEIKKDGFDKNAGHREIECKKGIDSCKKLGCGGKCKFLILKIKILLKY